MRLINFFRAHLPIDSKSFRIDCWSHVHLSADNAGRPFNTLGWRGVSMSSLQPSLGFLVHYSYISVATRPDQTKEDSWGRSLHAPAWRRRPSFCYLFLLSNSIAEMYIYTIGCMIFHLWEQVKMRLAVDQCIYTNINLQLHAYINIINFILMFNLLYNSPNVVLFNIHYTLLLVLLLLLLLLSLSSSLHLHKILLSWIFFLFRITLPA